MINLGSIFQIIMVSNILYYFWAIFYHEPNLNYSHKCFSFRTMWLKMHKKSVEFNNAEIFK